MVLALSDEKAAVVDKFLAVEGYTVRTAAGSRSQYAYGVNGIPQSFLVGADGKLLWKGHPNGLTRSKLRGLLGAGREPAGVEFLAVQPRPEALEHAQLAPAVEAARAGRLAAALEGARSFLDAEPAGKAISLEGRAAASVLARQIEEHVALLEGQATRYAEARDPLPALTILEGLDRALAGSAEGAEVQRRLESLGQDPVWVLELKAARALEDAVEAAIGQRRGETRKGFKALAKAYPETRAAERATRRAARK